MMEQIYRLPESMGSLMLSLHCRINQGENGLRLPLVAGRRIEVKTIVAICSGPGSIHRRYGCGAGFFTFPEG